MLSLPHDWDYTLKGLAAINKESVDAIRTAIWELEDAGYVMRTRVRDERGCLRGCDYYVYEYPQMLSSGSGSSALNLCRLCWNPLHRILLYWEIPCN